MWFRYLPIILFILSSCGEDSVKKTRLDISEVYVKNDTLFLKSSFWNRIFLNNLDKKFTGIVFEKYENGKMKFESTYVNGEAAGIQRGYFENGKLKIETTYVKGVESGIQRSYYENGLIKTELTIKNGMENGNEKRWYENGKLSSEQNYKNGILDGLCRYYRKNGQIVNEFNYKFKKEDLGGIFLGGRPRKVGDLNAEISIHLANAGEFSGNMRVNHDILDGTQREWFENGKIKYVENYTNGKKEGIQQFYYENGFIKSEENWKNDKLESKKCWDEMCILTICK